ncbi:MAG: LysR family transcriptional regulator [Maritimibacter sp.]
MNVSADLRLPLLELDLLRTLEAIAQTGNFSTAASTVGRTPSAISMQVKKLEELVGRKLFQRDSRSVRLTRDGELLLEHARRVLALNRDMVSRFVAPDLVGEVRLGAPDDVAERFMPGMLRQFADAHPGITVKVVVDRSHMMIEMLDAGELDLTVVTTEAGIREDVRSEIIFREPLVWAGLAGGVAVEQVPLPIAVWEPNCSWRRYALERLDEEGIAYCKVFESAHVTGQRAALLADMAVAQLPQSCIGGPIAEVGARAGLPELPNYALGLMVAEDPSEVVQAAVEHLRASFARRGSGGAV